MPNDSTTTMGSPALSPAGRPWFAWARHLGSRLLLAASVLVVASAARAAGDGGVAPATAKPAPSTPAASAPPSATPVTSFLPTQGFLCDDQWIGHFETIQIGRGKYDGRAIKDYDPSRPEEPWYILGKHYLFRQYEKNMMYKFIGRFWDPKETDAFRKLVVAEQRFWRHFDRNYRPLATGPGAYLVNDSFTCTLQRRNETIDQSNWIVELDGYLFVGRQSKCEKGKIRKTVTVVDCSGEKDLVKDNFEAPCNVGPVSSCLARMSPGMYGVQQDYSGSSLGRHLSFKVLDVGKRKKVFGISQVYDRSVGPDEWVRVKDVDNDGVPELVTEVCEEDSCFRKLVRKWNGRAFVGATITEKP